MRICLVLKDVILFSGRKLSELSDVEKAPDDESGGLKCKGEDLSGQKSAVLYFLLVLWCGRLHGVFFLRLTWHASRSHPEMFCLSFTGDWKES